MSKTNPIHLQDLKQDPRNARKHNKRNLDSIADSLNQLGAGRSILIDESNTIIAGNGVAQAAKTVGMTKIKIVETMHDCFIMEQAKAVKLGKTHQQCLVFFKGDPRSIKTEFPSVQAALPETIDMITLMGNSEA